MAPKSVEFPHRSVCAVIELALHSVPMAGKAKCFMLFHFQKSINTLTIILRHGMLQTDSINTPFSIHVSFHFAKPKNDFTRKCVDNGLTFERTVSVK